MSPAGKGRGGGKGRSGTGRSSRPGGKSGTSNTPRPAASGPSPAIVGGAALVVLALLGIAVAVAFKDPAPPPAASPLASATPEVEREPTPTPTPAPSATPTPSASEEPEDPEDLEAMLQDAEPSRAPAATPKPAASQPPLGPGGPLTGDPAKVSYKGETETVQVKRVIDGDTLDVADGRRIRLLGINTPEIGKAYKEDAAKVLRELTKSGTITLEYDGPKEKAKGRYGRTLAYVHCDGVFVNGEIVRRGLAYIYIYPTTKSHNEDLIGYQRQAREAKRYLWSKPLPEPATLYIGNRNAPYFHREGCDRIKKLKGRDRVEFHERNTALDAGMNPCEDCGS